MKMIESVPLCQAIDDEALPTRVCQSAAARGSKAVRSPGRACLGIAAGMPLLVLCDWLYDFSILAFPFAFYLRAVLLAAFALYLVHTGPRLGAYRFRFGRWLLCYLAVNLVYGCFRRPACQPVPCEPDRLLDSRHGGGLPAGGCAGRFRRRFCAIGATVLLGACSQFTS